MQIVQLYIVDTEPRNGTAEGLVHVRRVAIYDAPRYAGAQAELGREEYGGALTRALEPGVIASRWGREVLTRKRKQRRRARQRGSAPSPDELLGVTIDVRGVPGRAPVLVQRVQDLPTSCG